MPEKRWKDARGNEQVNLSPITNQCVDCLIAYTKETNETMRTQPDFGFDGRAAAARNND